MSRVGKDPIAVPNKVDVSIAHGEVGVKGPLGSLKHAFGSSVVIEREADRSVDQACECVAGSERHVRHGAGLIANMVNGVTKGFEKKLNLVGVGYRAQASGQRLSLSWDFPIPWRTKCRTESRWKRQRRPKS